MNDAALAARLRPELAELTAYAPHEIPGIDVKLDANEAPLGDLPAVRDAASRALGAVVLERYPDPRALRLKDAIARRTGARADELLVGTGSDEVIALLVNALGAPRSRNAPAVVLTPTPTFVMYRVTSRTHGLKPVEVPLDAAWDLDVAMTTKAIAMMDPNLVFIATPNNPTSNRVSDDRLEEVVVAAGAAHSFCVVDEAYVDYAGASLRSLRGTHPHVGILRTLSKIGLAALRIGWLEADAALVTEIDKTRQPYNLSAVAQTAAAAILESDDAWDELQSRVAAVVARRLALTEAIEGLAGFQVTPSAANFLWVRTPVPAKDVHEHLVRDGILVRSFHASGGRLASQLRITLGTDQDHARLVDSLRALRGAR